MSVLSDIAGYLFDLNASQNVFTGAYSPAADGDPVSKWTEIVAAREFLQATASQQPIYRASGINGLPAIDFDGSNDWLRCASAFLSGTAGAIIAALVVDAGSSAQTLLSSSYENSLVSTAVDSVGTKHGTLTNFTPGAAWSSDVPAALAGEAGLSLATDGVDDYVSIPDPGESTTALTAACWVKPNSSSTQYFFAHYGAAGTRSWAIGITTGPALIVLLSTNGSSITKQWTVSGFTTGVWHHVAFTFAEGAVDGTLKIYIDGVEATAIAKTVDNNCPTLFNSATNVSVGATSSGGNPFSGKVDDARIYNEVVSAANIASLASGTNYTGNILARWKFDDGVEVSRTQGLRATSTGNAVAYQQKDNDTADVLVGSTKIVPGTTYIVSLVSDGTAIRMRVNGVWQVITVTSGANNGDWWGDTASRDNVVVGALKGLRESEFFNGRVGRIVGYSAALSNDNVASAESYLAGLYGASLPTAPAAAPITGFRQIKRQVLERVLLSKKRFAEDLTYQSQGLPSRTVVGHVHVTASDQDPLEETLKDVERLEVLVSRLENNATTGGIANPRRGDRLWRAADIDADRRPFCFTGFVRERYADKHRLVFERHKTRTHGTP